MMEIQEKSTVLLLFLTLLTGMAVASLFKLFPIVVVIIIALWGYYAVPSLYAIIKHRFEKPITNSTKDITLMITGIILSIIVGIISKSEVIFTFAFVLFVLLMSPTLLYIRKVFSKKKNHC
jgi:hypothetical protein